MNDIDFLNQIKEFRISYRFKDENIDYLKKIKLNDFGRFKVVKDEAIEKITIKQLFKDIIEPSLILEFKKDYEIFINKHQLNVSFPPKGGTPRLMFDGRFPIYPGFYDEESPNKKLEIHDLKSVEEAKSMFVLGKAFEDKLPDIKSVFVIFTITEGIQDKLFKDKIDKLNGSSKYKYIIDNISFEISNNKNQHYIRILSSLVQCSFEYQKKYDLQTSIMKLLEIAYKDMKKILKEMIENE